jgi:hypothetical protein
MSEQEEDDNPFSQSNDDDDDLDLSDRKESVTKFIWSVI